MITQYDIAELSRPQIESKTRNELIVYAKELGLKGYSKLKKDGLVNLVFEASDIKRQALVKTQVDELILQKIKDKELDDLRKKESPMKLSRLEKTFRSVSSRIRTPELIADILYNQAIKEGYALITIAKTLTTDLKLSLQETNVIPREFGILLREAWKMKVRPINVERVNDETNRILAFADVPEKQFDNNTQAIIDWAITNLENTERIYYQAIAFSILTGRRMVEVFGTTKYELENEYIKVIGLAKKSNNYEFCYIVPLAPAKTLVDFINSYSKRGYTSRQVNGTLSKNISSSFPSILKDYGLDKFKDTRDFYSAVCVATFTHLGSNYPETLLTRIMGHSNTGSTGYYKKFKAEPSLGQLNVFKSFKENPC